MNGLARWMLDHWKTRLQREMSLARMEATHGTAFILELKERIMAEYHKRKASA